MSLSKEELYKLAEKYDKKAESALRNYQETGLPRYDTVYQRSDDIAEALRMAAAAADEHQKYINLRVEVSSLARTAEAIRQRTLPPEELVHTAHNLIENLSALAHILGLIQGTDLDRRRKEGRQQ